MTKKEFLSKAIELAHEVHKYEVDKAGEPYILHPLAVCDLLEDEIDKAIGVLHDTCETNIETFKKLEEINAPKEVIEALKLLTRDEKDTYKEYIMKIVESRNIRAIRVKLKDMEHNTSDERMNHLPEEKVKSLNKRYTWAKSVLEPVYVELMDSL